jgi:hypothetical protein
VGATIAQHEGTPQERYGTGWSEEPYERPRPGDDQRQEWRCDVHEDDGRRFGAGSSVAGAVLVSTNPSWIWPWGATPTVD